MAGEWGGAARREMGGRELEERREEKLWWVRKINEKKDKSKSVLENAQKEKRNEDKNKCHSVAMETGLTAHMSLSP